VGARVPPAPRFAPRLTLPPARCAIAKGLYKSILNASEHRPRVDGIVVISPALHAGGREFDPRSTYASVAVRASRQVGTQAAFLPWQVRSSSTHSRTR